MNTISLNNISLLFIQTRNPYKSIMSNFKKFGIVHYLQRYGKWFFLYILQNFKIKLWQKPINLVYLHLIARLLYGIVQYNLKGKYKNLGLESV